MSEKKNFEEKLEELNKIIADMNSENMPLDQLIKAYETGQELIKELTTEINEAKAKIKEYN